VKVAHWTMYNRSGMNRVAESFVQAEKALGVDAHLCNIQESKEFDHVLDADVHVAHTHFPDWMRDRVTKPLKLVWIGHGTPEHVFQSSVIEGEKGGYGFGDGWMLIQYWLQHADALVTFWPRHQAIWQSLCDKGRTVHCVPLGIDLDFWTPGVSKGKFAGSPSVFSAENAHYIKWPLDLFIAWPWVYPKVRGSCLHVSYLPTNTHRWFFPLVNRNGASYACHISSSIFGHEDLRNVFRSIDFFIGLVKYGDFNRINLEAQATGAKTISFSNNPYSDFWLPEGDQRILADTLVEILKGNVEPREDKLKVPGIKEMGEAMIKIYEGIV
jgi:hypothetical protein